MYRTILRNYNQKQKFSINNEQYLYNEDLLISCVLMLRILCFSKQVQIKNKKLHYYIFYFHLDYI